MPKFLAMLTICTITVSLAAIFFHFLSPILSKKYNAKWQYFTWLIIVIAFILPIRPTFDYRVYNPTVPIPATQAKLTESITYENIETVTQTSNDFSLFSGYEWIAFIWLMGVFVITTFYIIRHIRFVKLTHRWNEEVNDKQTVTLLAQVSAEMGILNAVQIHICPLISSPIMTGFFKPRILLPTEIYSSGELALIFRHELTHYKRKDLWCKALVLIATIIHWFNPAVYLTARDTNLQCELSCDEAVMQGADDHIRQQYTKTIINTVRQQNKLRPALSTNFQNGRKGVEKRISSILNPTGRRFGVGAILGIVLCVILTGAILTGYAYPSVQYFEKKWEANARLNRNVFMMEPDNDTRFMGNMRIAYSFNNDNRPSWLDSSQEDYWLQQSAYEIIVIKGVEVNNKIETDAYADSLLAIKYDMMEHAGFSDKKPAQSDYTYKIEFSENLENYQINDFLRARDENGSIVLSPSEIDFTQIYKISYEKDGDNLTVYIDPAHPETADMEQSARESITSLAKHKGIILPDNFEDYIHIEKVTDEETINLLKDAQNGN